MHKKTPFIIIFIFSIAGTLFAGYLTISKLLLGYCPLKEPCPVILGQPACVYGFALYIILFVSSAVLLFHKKIRDKAKKCWLNTVFWISLVGIIFALYSTYLEIFTISCPGGCSYSLLLPTCIYGLTMYIIIFVFSNVAKK
jgi:hypothetical protein